MFIDSHFHCLEMQKKGLDVPSVIEEAVDAGFTGGIDAGIVPEDFYPRKELLKPYPEIYLSAGLFPGGSEHETMEAELEELERILASGEASALGEIGLDYHWNYADPKRQRDLFRRQIILANTYTLPVIIHSRDADADLLSVLTETPPEYGGIMHCFSSGYETAKKCIDAGLLISFAGNVTYKNADTIGEAAKKIPMRSLLAETDAPYLSPAPLRGKKNRPKNVLYTYSYIAELRGLDKHELQTAVSSNFTELFSAIK